MPTRTEEIVNELERIRASSPTDVAVLMTPLVKALELAPKTREHNTDATQLATMASSLAQMADQAGDPVTAIAIASIQAEIESLSEEDLGLRETVQTPAPPGTPETAARNLPPDQDTVAPKPPEPPPVDPFAHPMLQFLGLASVCALSYAGYIAVQSIFSPGSVVNWLLTGSTTLLALGIGLRWRRFVMSQAATHKPTIATGALVVAASCAMAYGVLALRPRLTPEVMELAVTETATQPQPAPDIAVKTEGSRSADAEQPIALWWMGDAESLPTRLSTAQGRTAALDDPSAADGAPAEHEVAKAEMSVNATRRPVSSPLANREPTRQELYQAMLNRHVVLTDTDGVRHHGTLTGVSNDGVTLHTEVLMFGEPILAHRLYLYSSIAALDLD